MKGRAHVCAGSTPGGKGGGDERGRGGGGVLLGFLKVCLFFFLKFGYLEVGFFEV